MKNYGDRGGCYPSRPYRDLHNSSYDTKAEFNHCFIISIFFLFFCFLAVNSIFRVFEFNFKIRKMKK